MQTLRYLSFLMMLIQGLKGYKYKTMKLNKKIYPFFLRDTTCLTKTQAILKVKGKDKLLKIAQR